MNHLQLIQGKQAELSLQEIIYKQIKRLNEGNKKYCLELIMLLEADERIIFLNAFMVAMNHLGHNNIAAA
ncbi:hypothetical protein [Vitreoscilla stercoraria]|uniref:Uncharacterized protein n=1 Tax=Vitreoscilla stercoraria TaxID=61 RepID=A0ABY4E7C0_VITST|nr:hypothetical protein [Vitreoscilla stercoraria]UOO91676.1 hypothetical protein LVJ81_08470 [Vitreoscilla stercoraria]